MKPRNLVAMIEFSSELAQSALKKYIKKALEREKMIDVAGVTLRTDQPVKAKEQRFAPGEPGYSDDQ